ncbi:hypothetical protein [Halomarina pelagica]|uniref:hypothetical protein n=1 Tax=Halomarina pelagica TaxID=2961599 RepID=UPI0020C4F695|nr:hypothetical protein [Halomarina sp. BND7]
MALVDTIIVFLIGLIVGAAGIYVGARVITGAADFTYAVITALVASAVWAIVAFLFGWVPLLGPLLALVAYLGVINWRYPGGWLSAAGIALIAWLASLIIVYVLALLGVVAPDAAGVVGA